MKYRKRQYLFWFLWSSRMIMSRRSNMQGSPCVLALFAVILMLSSSSKECSNLGTVCSAEGTELGAMSPRVVFTKQGPVQGFLGPGNVGAHYLSQTDGSYTFRHYTGRPVVEIFKGIPYSSAPVGNLRYESPNPPPLRSRTQIYNANVSKPACPSSYSQILNRTSVPGDPIRALKKTMELEAEADDCLYLDIYLPLNSNKNRGTGLPVLVFANSQMDDPQNPFDGSSMAAIGNIIVIMFRYRVAVLGFVRPGFTDDIRSNFGLWDQLAALQWIKENVEEFGGDQHNITYMAYDLDATLAGLLSLSPVSQAYNGLFHRLILLNGSPFSPHSINHQPQKTTFHLARNLKCPLDERMGDLANCFRRTPVPQLFGSADSIGAPLLTYPFAPIVDGTLVPVDVSREDQRNQRSVLDMLGKYDLLCGLKMGAVLPRMGRPILREIDLSSFVTAAIKLTMKLENDVEPTDQLKREVMKSITEVYGLTPPMREVVSDFLLVHPVKQLLKAHSGTQKNTFFYVFQDFDPLRLNQQNEISYIFSDKVYYWKYHSNVPDYRHLVSDARTEELKPGYGMGSPRPYLYPFVLLINLLASFVRTGDPNLLDPNDRFPNSGKPWPKFDGKMGRYMEIGKEVEFPSGYRKATTDFWERAFPDLLKTFGNQSSSTSSSNYGDFFPFPPPGGNSDDNNHPPISHYPDPPMYDGDNDGGGGHGGGGLGTEGDGSSDSVLSGIGQNTVVLIGALLLLLNFLCFIGLFYQRERLKKTELQLRRRFLDSRSQNPETSQEMDTASASFERAIPVHESNHIIPRGGTPGRDAMSETETENGFGPDFLGPNYDPRTKVNRWMNMQNAHRAMLSKDNSFENPSPSISDFHMIPRREGDMGDPGLTVLPLPPPLQPSNISHSLSLPHPHHQNHYQQHHHPPLHIQVTSLQRNSHVPKMMPMSMSMDHHNHQHYQHPHQHQHPPPVQILPPLPYQEPYQPSASVVGDIPYADSRATSPLPIAAPDGYSNSSPVFRPQYHPQNKGDSLNRRSRKSQSPPPFASPSPVPGPSTKSQEAQEPSHRRSNPFQEPSPVPLPPEKTLLSPKPQSPPPPSVATAPPQTPTFTTPPSIPPPPEPENKRTSVVIVRDLDPVDPELERAEPKLVPVKTGTLKRSVGVDTAHDGSPAKKENSAENNTKRGSSQIRVTFSEKV